MILIIQPFKHDKNSNFVSDIIGIAFSFGAAICAALAVIFNKDLSDNLHFSVVSCWYMGSISILSPIWSFFQQTSGHPEYCWGLVGYTVAIGVGFYVMLMLMTRAIKMMNA